MSWNQACHAALSRLQDIEPSHLRSALELRFDIEHISKYFESVEYSFTGSDLEVRTQDCILMEFASLQAEHPDLYPAKQYRLLLLLALHKCTQITTGMSLELDTIRRKDNINRIVIWSCETFDAPALHSLKSHAIDVISLDDKDIEPVTSIGNYVPVEGKDHDYALALNLAADLLVKRLKKMFHLVLSEVAAPIYDRLYTTQKVATAEMMRYEEKVLRDLIQRYLPKEENRSMAVDVGCGTGRHTFPLAKSFDVSGQII